MQGSISILMIIILLPMMTLSGLIVDTSRINMARQMMSSAGDLAMNTALANYDTILKDVYGLFAMSQEKTAGMSEEDAQAQLTKDIKDYFEKTLVEYNVVNEAQAGDYVEQLLGSFSELVSGTSDMETSNFLKLENVNVTVEGIKSSSLAEAPIMRKQIVEYMKYRAPLNFGLSFLDTLKTFETVNEQNKVVEKQVAAEEKTQDVTQACSALIKLIREYDDLINNINGEGNKKVTGSAYNVDGVTIPIENYDTHLEKYLKEWSPDYEHINKLSLVFLANTPSTSACYLDKLGSRSFFTTETVNGVIAISGVVEKNSGISISTELTLAEKRDEAKIQVENQIATLSAETGEYRINAQAYINKGFLNASYLNSTKNAFVDEGNAINTFVAYEKFLLNSSSDINYITIKPIFQEILELEKYFVNYKDKYQIDMSVADAELTEATIKVADAQTKYDEEKDKKKKESLKTELDNAKNVQDEKQKVVDDLNQELDALKANYSKCLEYFLIFVDAYQGDLQYYKTYTSVAETVATAEAIEVTNQINKIRSNVKELVDKLDAISKQIGVVQTAITTYQTEVDNWEKAKDTYESSVDTDSFSKQSESDISTARTQYNADDYTTLLNFVNNKKTEFNNFYTYLEGENLLYGSKKLYEIITLDELKTAFSPIKSSLTSSVTVDEANGKLSTLYKYTASDELDPYTISGAQGTKQLGFLEPTVLQIASLKYLNASYPEASNRDAKADAQTKTDYETKKEELKKGSGSKVQEVSPESEVTTTDEQGKTITTNKFGYTYKDISAIDKTLLPSASATTKKATETEFKLSEEEGKINASAGVSSQASTVSNMLSGIGTAVNAGIENAYILSYLFENFSYNTMVQDVIIDSSEEKITTLDKAKTELNKDDVLKKYVDKLTTLSNFEKNGKNNYLYGAEVEYILYGNKNPAKNITYAKGSVYALRFAFNCIYAFTNSEIRTTTMTAGLSVQAATLGIVPYQIVQIVLQLALAAAESAVDLEMMNCGLKVAVVKTKDTWMLSVSNAAKTVVGVVGAAAADVTKTAIKNVSAGIQEIVDAGADEIKNATDELSNSLWSATEQAVTEVVDQAFGYVMDQVESKLNELQTAELKTKEAVTAKIDELFLGIETRLTNELNSMFEGNELASKILPHVTPEIKEIIGKVKTSITTKLNKVTTEDAGAYVLSHLEDIKIDMITQVTDSVAEATKYIGGIVTDAVGDVQTQITNYISEQGENLSEEASKVVKEKITTAANGYINKYLDVGNPKAIGGGSTSSSIASVIKFGYKDYLMLFTYIAICVNDNAILKRTSDIIQLNIQNAGDNAGFKHKKGSEFLMENARTYVSVNASADMDMFFMNMDIFAKTLGLEESDIAANTIKYKGLLGY